MTSTRLATALADRYAIEEPFGEGGMAPVHLAHDVRHGRHVALEVLRPELAYPIDPERFLPRSRPPRTSSKPTFPAPSIRARPTASSIRVARDRADALDYGHCHRVAHCDFEPVNIPLREGRVVVAGFLGRRELAEVRPAGPPGRGELRRGRPGLRGPMSGRQGTR